MSAASVKNVINKMCLEIIYSIYMQCYILHDVTEWTLPNTITSD